MNPAVLLALSLSLAVCLSGCPKQEDPSAEPTPAAEPAKPAPVNQIEQARATARAQTAARGLAVSKVGHPSAQGDAVMAAPTAPADGTPAAPADAKPSEPEGPPDLPPVKFYLEINERMDSIFSIMERHKDDCEKAAVEVEAYAQKHRAEMVSLSKQLSDALEKLGEEDQQKFRAWAMSNGQQTLKKAMGTMMEFHQKCPEHMQRINKQVRTLTIK